VHFGYYMHDIREVKVYLLHILVTITGEICRHNLMFPSPTGFTCCDLPIVFINFTGTISTTPLSLQYDSIQHIGC
jgi:hypothetical protein